MCRKPLVAGREVVVTDLATWQRHFYRCVHCAIVAMSRQFPQARAELTSAVQRRPITLLRDGDQWRSKPDTAVLLILPEENGECIARHQTFADPEEFQAYLRDHPNLAAQKPQSYDLSDVDAIIRAGYAGGP
jgi:hypothetical protein